MSNASRPTALAKQAPKPAAKTLTTPPLLIEEEHHSDEHDHGQAEHDPDQRWVRLVRWLLVIAALSVIIAILGVTIGYMMAKKSDDKLEAYRQKDDARLALPPTEWPDDIKRHAVYPDGKPILPELYHKNPPKPAVVIVDQGTAEEAPKKAKTEAPKAAAPAKDDDTGADEVDAPATPPSHEEGSPPAPKATVPNPEHGPAYQVRPGDSLAKISAEQSPKHCGLKGGAATFAAKVLEANAAPSGKDFPAITNAADIKAGKWLYLPKECKTTAESTASTP